MGNILLDTMYVGPAMVAVKSWNLSSYLTEESPANIEASK